MLIFTPFATMATGDTFLGYIFGDFGNPSEEIEFFSSKMTISGSGGATELPPVSKES